MESIKEEIKQKGTGWVIMMACLFLIASILLVKATIEVVSIGGQSLIICSGLALIIAITTAKHPINLFGTNTCISTSEAIIFLAVITLGPYHGLLLGAIDMFLVSHRFRVKPSLFAFNISNQVASVFVAGKTYAVVAGYLTENPLAGESGNTLLRFALPLVALALTDYMLQFTMVVLMLYLERVGKIGQRIRGMLPWEPITYLANATVAGLISYVFYKHGVIPVAVTLLLVLPVPIIIYYTFRTYRDKLSGQEKHYQELTSIYDSILEMLAMAIDAKDDVTHDHIQRVKLFAGRMGEMVGLSNLEIEALKAGSLLHDIGKIGVPAYILNKPGKLTQHEFEQMKMHTIIGADMLSNVNFRYPVVPIVRHHHERWDGRGYPDGLKGEQIPITARILTLVDNYDALRSDRPYKKGMTREEALEYIKQNAGTFFDPHLVEMFLSTVDQLEAEASASSFKPPESKKRSPIPSAAMASASPAAGLQAEPQIDRAAAALNSIAETNQRVTALYEMSRTLASIISVEDTVAILANRLAKLVPFTTCAISLFDASRSEFEIVHALGLHADRFLHRRQPAEAGITGYVITNQRAMYNTKPALDIGFLGAEAANEYKGVMVFPLVKNQEALGAIALYSTEIETYAVDHIQLMDSISQPASDAVYNAIAYEQAQRDALTDAATGLANMRALTTQFERERARSERLGTPLAMVLLCLNSMGELSSRPGAGTESLVAELGKMVKQQVRETDLVACYSTNTLIALLPDTGLAEASDVRARIRQAVYNLEIGDAVQISLGSAVSPGDGSTLEELLQAAKIDSIAGLEALTTFRDLGFNDKPDQSDLVWAMKDTTSKAS
ncbi:MAG TPA: HD domain-containing phosphohydrolase [Blastocatellia bacterium]|nr:HD domain-containing phosphohydrolase [Blastocatellia bacterium]